MTRFGDRLALKESLGGCGGAGFGADFVEYEYLRGSMAMVKGREIWEAKSCQRQGVYTIRTRGRSAEI